VNQVDGAVAAEEIRRFRTSRLFGFEVRDVREEHGSIDMEIAGRASVARLRIAAPSSNRAQHWLYAAPEDERDWAEQLLTWIQEEVATGGLSSSRARVEIGGKSYVVAVAYGWRRAEEAEHLRLQRATPPTGW
jgi:hypothetical protein